MYEIMIINRVTVFIEYINAGPTYILTRLTSSLILFIKSPTCDENSDQYPKPVPIKKFI